MLEAMSLIWTVLGIYLAVCFMLILIEALSAALRR